MQNNIEDQSGAIIDTTAAEVQEQEQVVETGPVYLTEAAPAEGFPVDDWKGVESLHQDQISSHYGKRCIDLGLHYKGCNIVTIIDDLMKQYGHAEPTAWRKFIEPDALKPEFDEATRIELARGALHVKLLTVVDEDITPLLIAINAKDVGPYWLGYFERHVVPSMVRMGV